MESLTEHCRLIGSLVCSKTWLYIVCMLYTNGAYGHWKWTFSKMASKKLKKKEKQCLSLLTACTKVLGNNDLLAHGNFIHIPHGPRCWATGLFTSALTISFTVYYISKVGRWKCCKALILHSCTLNSIQCLKKTIGCHFGRVVKSCA